MPVAYTDYFNRLFSEKCKLFYFEIQGNLTESGMLTVLLFGWELRYGED